MTEQTNNLPDLTGLVIVDQKEVWRSKEAEAAYATLEELRAAAAARASRAFHEAAGEITKPEQVRRELELRMAVEAATREIVKTMALLVAEHQTIVVTYRRAAK